MPYEYWEDDWQEFNDRHWDNVPGQLFDDLTHGAAWDDDFAKMLFDLSFVNTDAPDVTATARDMLVEWLEQQYDVDFYESFDWDTWREWYG